MRRLRFVPDVTTIDFMGRARLWVALSILLTVGSIVLIFTRDSTSASTSGAARWSSPRRRRPRTSAGSARC